jgi:hypothetical protein
VGALRPSGVAGAMSGPVNHCRGRHSTLASVRSQGIQRTVSGLWLAKSHRGTHRAQPTTSITDRTSRQPGFRCSAIRGHLP